ncbi:hypothetical protein CAOG_003523 [Capsaspora owczarzaki ATCC 30864]|uniref:3'-5' exonuclease n=2 Tax=Capsaspora owczarzaki (strain ATCC 30864) TaxID=595528 RepID=A0A0D2WNE3_CAPO3|nr:hypothetical protein CAOG_003523 [Capsaspora owczarzaki ATCC 30864]
MKRTSADADLDTTECSTTTIQQNAAGLMSPLLSQDISEPCSDFESDAALNALLVGLQADCSQPTPASEPGASARPRRVLPATFYMADASAPYQATATQATVGDQGDDQQQVVQAASKRRTLPWASAPAVAPTLTTEGSAASSMTNLKDETTGSPQLEVGLPRFQFSGSVVYITDVEVGQIQCADLMSQLVSRLSTEGQDGADGQVAPALGFDIEWFAPFIRGQKARPTALLQLAVENGPCYLFHLIQMQGIPPALQELLADSRIAKVGVGIKNDVTRLVRDYSLKVNGAVDLEELAAVRVVPLRTRWSLQALVQKTLNCLLDKSSELRLGNWEEAPLSWEMQEYAANDAHASLQTYLALVAMPVLNYSFSNGIPMLTGDDDKPNP